MKFLIHHEKVFRNESVRFMNKGVNDVEKFFVNKWPNLRTNRLQEGGYDAIPVTSCYDTIRCHQEWPKLEGPKCKMKLNYKLI
ncbi:hypothetical protein J1N35_037527 [Gossypium stocksii]|uniref:Uncharacterized protein n=1 Tax=Gossypium stocksii TaxID=47602 RepID=A0A9D3ZLQ9_9ROSI|nr:hypothetical protein J1N35_037527 [Gossypium stocksii]